MPRRARPRTTAVPDATRLDVARRASLGHQLFEAARLLDERALARVNAAPGRPPGLNVRPAHTRLFPHITAAGIRITTLAERVGVTKQAVGPLVAELEAWGAVEQVPDPTDGRARLVRWTPFGVQANLHGLSILAGFEAELAARIGPARTREFRRSLADFAALLAEEEADTSAPGRR